MCSLTKRVLQKLYLFVITVFNAYFVVWCSTCNLLVHIFGQFFSAFNCDVPELQCVCVFFRLIIPSVIQMCICGVLDISSDLGNMEKQYLKTKLIFGFAMSSLCCTMIFCYISLLFLGEITNHA